VSRLHLRARAGLLLAALLALPGACGGEPAAPRPDMSPEPKSLRVCGWTSTIAVARYTGRWEKVHAAVAPTITTNVARIVQRPCHSTFQ